MALPDIEKTMAKLIPDAIKPSLRPTYYRLKSTTLYKRLSRLARPVKSREELHKYWRRPQDPGNWPQDYMSGEERSRLLAELACKYCRHDARILEIGCNVGRNLNYLFLTGFKSLEGVEINADAVRLLKKTYPDMAQYATIHNSPVENVIEYFESDVFDLVFTMAVLEHIHPDSEWIFPEMARITKSTLITIEDENDVSWGIFPRNYRKIFETLEMKQAESFRLNEISELGASYTLRVFEKTVT